MTKPRENPWFSSAIKVIIAFKKLKQYKTSQHAAQYKTLRKNDSQLINQENRKYFFTRLNKATTISSSACPTIWNDSFIIPLHKKCAKVNVQNYRGHLQVGVNS